MSESNSTSMERSTLAAAMARSASMLARAANSHSRSQSRSFGHGLILDFHLAKCPINTC